MKTQSRILKNIVPLLRKKNNLLSIETECLYGENFTILEKDKDWCYGYLNDDNYHGWLKLNSLGEMKKPNFYVSSPGTIILKKPNVKSLPINYLSIGSKIYVKKKNDAWAEVIFFKKNISLIGYVSQSHLTKINCHKLDWVNIAESMIGVPYKWGGKTNLGVDCSGLLQISLKLAGINSPRNSTTQKNKLGYNLFTKDELHQKKYINLWDEKIKRGDLIFWEGHVGIINKKLTILHANTDTNNVATQNSKKLLKRYFDRGLIPLAIKRLN